jgi:adenine deaminase
MTSADVAELLAAGAPAIGETVWTRLEQEDRDYVRTVQTCREAGLRVSGHGGEIPRGVAAAFDAYVAAGPVDDHCINRPADIEPRLRRGMHQFFVECTGRRGQLSPLLAEMLRRGLPLRRVSICIDNNTAMDIVTNGYGYMDYLVRVALDAGIPPVDAYRMATLHPAEHHREAASLGSVTPGRFADLIVMDDFSSFPPHKVIVDGRVVAEEGRLVVDVMPPASADVRRQTILIPTLRPEQLRLEAPSMETYLVRVIKAHDGDAFNTERLIELPVRNGALHADPLQDLLKIAVVERFGRFGTLGLGIVEGFGLKHGAIATSISVPFNNIVCVGTDDHSMWTAIKRIEALQGGFVVAADDEVLADVPLAFGGLMSLEPFETFLDAVSVAEAIARERGCRLANPFKTLVSTVHTTLPDLGLTDRGLVDTKNGRPVSIFVEPARTPLPA